MWYVLIGRWRQRVIIGRDLPKSRTSEDPLETKRLLEEWMMIRDGQARFFVRLGYALPWILAASVLFGVLFVLFVFSSGGMEWRIPGKWGTP